MNTSYIFVNIIACLCCTILFIVFLAAERSREINAWLLLLLAMTLWTGGSLFMRLDVFPNYKLWYYVSLISLFSIPALVYNYVYQVAKENSPKIRMTWIIGTVIIIIISLTGFFLKPPIKIVDSLGHNAFVYKSDSRIAFPVIFLCAIVVSIIKMFNKIFREIGNRAPGVNELIVGCEILALGNIVQILPGNTFPWDTLSGIVFVVLITVSLYRRYMFNTSLLVSRSFLLLVIYTLSVLTAALFFPRVCAVFEKYGHKVSRPEVATFILLSAIMFIAIYGFRQLLNAIFHDEDKQSNKIKKYSDIVSASLSVDEILDETVKVIESEIKVNQLYICLHGENGFVPVYSSLPMDSLDFVISDENPCVKYLQNGNNQLVLKELESAPMYKSAWQEDCKVFEDKDIVSICAIKDNGNVMGLLLLTEKVKDSDKGNSYNYSDFAFLNTVCSVSSMALKNASLYEHVAEREHLFSEMTACIPTVILIKKKDVPSFCFISANTEKTLGLPYEFFEQHSPEAALAECIGEEKADEIIREFAISPESGYIADVPFTRPDDKQVHTIRATFSVIVSEGVISHYVYVLSDISADIEAKKLLKSSVELAQNSSKAKGEFLSHMSHEIRTPMNSIAGLAYLAREQLDENDKSELAGYLNQIDQSSHYLLNLLNNIMDMSKIENNLYEIRQDPFEINKVIDEVTAVYIPQMQAKGISFECNVDELSSKTLIGDEIALQKILNNLLSNAYKFTPEGGTVKFFATQRYVGNKSVFMHFEISDTGVGISKEFAEKIFEPYTQETTANGNHTGSGLGMAICKNMVDMMGGTITANSDIGKGTEFIVDIPYSLSKVIKSDEDKVELEFSILSGKRIMVVDDVAVNTMITRKLLEKYGVIVDCAENGEQALALFDSNKEFHYDCILMDIQMPVMDGFESTETIRGKKSRYASIVPIIAMTADAFISDTSNAIRSIFDGYIIKPVSPDVLYSTLIKLFKERD